MHREIYNDSENEKRNLTSIDRLNEYIENYERSFGEIRVKNVTSHRHKKIIRSIQNLQTAIEKDKISREQGTRYLNQYQVILLSTDLSDDHNLFDLFKIRFFLIL